VREFPLVVWSGFWRGSTPSSSGIFCAPADRYGCIEITNRAFADGTVVTLRLSRLCGKRSGPFVAFHFESLRWYRSCRRHICDVDSHLQLSFFQNVNATGCLDPCKVLKL
jgi:hypothetical protein